jgi:hypothetical protein
VDARAAARGGDEARQNAHGGGLPGAVRSEEADDLASMDLEADFVEGAQGPVSLGQRARLDHHIARQTDLLGLLPGAALPPLRKRWTGPEDSPEPGAEPQGTGVVPGARRRHPSGEAIPVNTARPVTWTVVSYSQKSDGGAEAGARAGAEAEAGAGAEAEAGADFDAHPHFAPLCWQYHPDEGLLVALSPASDTALAVLLPMPLSTAAPRAAISAFLALLAVACGAGPTSQGQGEPERSSGSDLGKYLLGNFLCQGGGIFFHLTLTPDNRYRMMGVDKKGAGARPVHEEATSEPAQEAEPAQEPDQRGCPWIGDASYHDGKLVLSGKPFCGDERDLACVSGAENVLDIKSAGERGFVTATVSCARE